MIHHSVKHATTKPKQPCSPVITRMRGGQVCNGRREKEVDKELVFQGGGERTMEKGETRWRALCLEKREDNHEN